MPKRFTDSDKWEDKWFRRLKPDQKLAYLYLLDRCDMAGTIELDEDLAEFQMGCSTDWEGLVKGSDTRLLRLDNGRIWIRKFMDFQHGQLSEHCNAHKAALRLIERYQLPISNENKGKQTKGTRRVTKPLGKGPGKGIGKGSGNSKGNSKDVARSRHFESSEFLELWEKWKAKQAASGSFLDVFTEEGQLYELEKFDTTEATEVVRFSLSRTNCKNLIINGDHKQKPKPDSPSGYLTPGQKAAEQLKRGLGR